MRECKTCEQELDAIYFLKPDGTSFYKLCPKCRELGRERNGRRKEAKNLRAQEHYKELDKEKLKTYNKAYREKNKEKLREYSRSDARKEMHRQWKKLKRAEDPSTFLFYAAKRRAKLNGIPFSISKDDIRGVFPPDKKCPVLGIDLCVSNNTTTDNSPSLDRIIPEKGYVPENIIVISHRANRIKNNATVDELEKVASFLRGLDNG